MRISCQEINGHTARRHAVGDPGNAVASYDVITAQPFELSIKTRVTGKARRGREVVGKTAASDLFDADEGIGADRGIPGHARSRRQHCGDAGGCVGIIRCVNTCTAVDGVVAATAAHEIVALTTTQDVDRTISK